MIRARIVSLTLGALLALGGDASAPAGSGRWWDSARVPIGGSAVLGRSLYVLGSGQADLWTGLAGWWPLDDSSGSTARDLSGLGRSGTLIGGAAWGADYLALDGVDDGVSLPLAASVQGSSAWTVCVWAYRTGAVRAARAFAEANAAGTGYRIQLGVGATGIATVTARNSAGTAASAIDAAVLPADSWHHMCATWSTSLALFVDGSMKQRYGTVFGAPMEAGAVAVQLGVPSWATGVAWPGRLSGARIWVGRELSAAQISALYARGRP